MDVLDFTDLFSDVCLGMTIGKSKTRGGGKSVYSIQTQGQKKHAKKEKQSPQTGTMSFTLGLTWIISTLVL